MSPRWYTECEEPDYRFTLANERTFLAWLRTSLALVAGAVALTQMVPPFAIAGVRTGLAVLLAVAGTVLAGLAYRRWASVQRAMRHRRPLPMDWLPAVVGVVAALTGLVVVFVVVVR
ncbi:YidH family protein [Amycolatopsis sp. NPDC051903]|uniref:YidH family protein n=1 Tax=Amycolatopsis sp. NPDC051903 TaxID=3363936 RepID=UPI0037A3EE4B